MNVKKPTIEQGTAKIIVEIAPEEFRDALNKAYAKQKGKIQIPGFRKGHAPRAIVEGMYGASFFHEDAINGLFPEVYERAVVDQKVKAVGSPSVTSVDVTPEGACVLTVETALYPEAELGEYKGVEAPKGPVSVTEKDVDAEIDRLTERNSRIETVERAAKEGDTLVFDFEGFVDGEPFEGGKAEKHTLKLGSGQFIPGFEDALIGVSAGEDKEVPVTFPEDYAKELAGKAAIFRCKIHEVKETFVPEKDDEFAKDVSEFDTMEDLRKDIKSNLKKERTERANRDFENAAVEAAAANMQAEIPACMVNEQLDKNMEQFTYQLQMNGMRVEDYMKMTGSDMNALRTSMRPMAETAVRVNILLAAVAEKEALEISDKELEEEFTRVAEQYQMEVEKVKEALDQAALRSDLLARKAAKLIAENAVAKKPEKTPAKKVAEKPADEKKPTVHKASAKKEALEEE